MSYKLEKPFSSLDQFKFRMKYACEMGLRIADTENALYALEDSECLQDGKVIIDPEYEQKQEVKKRSEKISAITQKLNALDLKTIRPLRSGETDRLKELEAQAIELRKELQKLSL